MAFVYQVSPAPQKYDPEWMERELKNIAEALAAIHDHDISFQVTRPREGMVRYFNSTVYDPGAGTGLYQYSGGAWSKL